MIRIPKALGALVLPALVLAMVSCTSSQGEEQRGGGLQQDRTVDMTWGDQQQISYLNTLKTNAQWLTSSDYISFPRAVAVDERLNRLYVAEQHGVRMVDLTTGDVAHFVTLKVAHGLAVAPDGRVYAVDAAAKAVRVFTQNAEPLFDIGFELPKGIAIDGTRGRLYVADAGTNTVTAWTLDGQYLSALTPNGENWALPLQPAVNSKGDVYVVHWGETTVHVFDAAGTYLRGFGEKGVYPTQFTRPKGIAVDRDDNVYVADAAFGNVQVFDSQDRLAVWFGNGGSGTGEFNIPGLLTIDSQNRIYVPEFSANRVQIFQYQAGR